MSLYCWLSAAQKTKKTICNWDLKYSFCLCHSCALGRDKGETKRRKRRENGDQRGVSASHPAGGGLLQWWVLQKKSLSCTHPYLVIFVFGKLSFIYLVHCYCFHDLFHGVLEVFIYTSSISFYSSILNLIVLHSLACIFLMISFFFTYWNHVRVFSIRVCYFFCRFLILALLTPLRIILMRKKGFGCLLSFLIHSFLWQSDEWLRLIFFFFSMYVMWEGNSTPINLILDTF